MHLPSWRAKRLPLRRRGHPSPKIDRFREMAKQLECDEDAAAFRDKLRVIAKQKPQPAKPQQGDG